MVITQTPLRISLAGGGTDFEAFYAAEGGMVVSTAIDKFVYVIAQPRRDHLFIVNYSRREEVDNLDDLQHDLAREVIRLVWKKPFGVEIHTMSDIHLQGSGLGSSSAVTVGLLEALYSLQGVSRGARELAEEACVVEIEKCKKPIGRQDQYICAYGGLCSITFLEDRNLALQYRIEEAGRRELEKHFMLFCIGMGRTSESVLSEQCENTPKNVEALRHLKFYAKQTLDILDRWDIPALGVMLRQTWELKKTLASCITNPRIDHIYERAIGAGASGGKICGAGNGGHLLLFVLPKHQEAVRKAMERQMGVMELPFHFCEHGSRVIFNNQ